MTKIKIYKEKRFTCCVHYIYTMKNCQYINMYQYKLDVLCIFNNIDGQKRKRIVHMGDTFYRQCIILFFNTLYRSSL